MKMKTTKGPWALGADGEKIITDYRDEFDNMTDENWLKGGWAKSVCKINYGSWMADDEAKANANLIASAPSLASALNEIIECEFSQESAYDYMVFVRETAKEALSLLDGR